MKDKRAQPRWLQRLKAHLGGYYWLPCGLCYEYFGGHESNGVLMYSRTYGESVCANCTEKAKRLNKELLDTLVEAEALRERIGDALEWIYEDICDRKEQWIDRIVDALDSEQKGQDGGTDHQAQRS